MKEHSGILVVVTGPSGAGKDSVLEQARLLGLEFGKVTTTTTRSMRPGEAEGNPYYFVTRKEFEEKIQQGEMIEWAEVYSNLYGCTKEEVNHARKKQAVVIVRVDPQGARTYTQLIPDAITLFIQPPSFEFLEKRLVNRAADAPEVIQQRLSIARKEMQHLEQWDYRIINEEGKLQEAAQELIRIVEEQKFRTT